MEEVLFVKVDKSTLRIIFHSIVINSSLFFYLLAWAIIDISSCHAAVMIVKGTLVLYSMCLVFVAGLCIALYVFSLLAA